MPFAATWMDLQIIIKVKETARQMPYDATYMWNLKHDTKELSTKQKQTHRYREQTCDCQGAGG